MIGIDTNILLRATLNDDPVQSAAARRFLKGLGETERGHVNLPVLLEFFWVLRTRYKLPRSRLSGVMRDLLGVEYIEFEALESVGKALAHYENGAADFADAIIALRYTELGASKSVTFDEDAAKAIPSMELLS